MRQVSVACEPSLMGIKGVRGITQTFVVARTSKREVAGTNGKPLQRLVKKMSKNELVPGGTFDAIVTANGASVPGLEVKPGTGFVPEVGETVKPAGLPVTGTMVKQPLESDFLCFPSRQSPGMGPPRGGPPPPAPPPRPP